MTPPVFAHGHLRLYLLSLLDEQPRHGYELIQALSERFDGTYAPSAGTIYPRLAKLEAEGLVTKESDGRKTIYRITPAGHQEVLDRADELEAIEKDVDSSVQRLARQVREGLSNARNQMRAEFDQFARDARDAAGPAGGRASEYGQRAADRASEYGQRAAEGARAGWTAASDAHRDGQDFFGSATAGFRAATGQEGVREPTGGAAGTGQPHPEPGPSPEPTHPASDETPSADTSISQRVDLVMGTFRQDIRQEIRSADRKGTLSPDIVTLVDVELDRVRALVRHALSMRD